ncbi:undecaprenyl/decaprenyl-phosphate alpha-N-acetylglucosaminyl 1-phosphate transferase [Nitrospiraceae bacterium AH_259_D15_M11_P09]|nr:undecaprenyl/decaprenyl-phosphate alpha-N-acetylglucosaminyl 1-phosphate transferase [Nitrospiraceae bacterium AH_259_D15_M11_P09]
MTDTVHPAGAERGRWLILWFWVGLAGVVFLLATPVRDLFVNEGMRWLYILILSFAASFGLTPIMFRLGHRLGLVDQPAERKIHWEPTPRIGGLAIYLGFVVAVVANSILVDWMIAILVSGSLLLVVGLLDDKWELPAWVKLSAQVGGAGLVIYSGKVLTLFPSGVPGDVANILLTFLWIVGITNAFNFFDGMDGLATGLAILIAFFMGLVAFDTNQPYLGWLALAMIGAGIGFFPYNFSVRRPGLIFLGDGGSTFLGFTLACLAVKGNWADYNPIVSFSNPLLIFGVLIYDMIHITVERVLTKKVRTVKEWIDFVGRDHLHHRLERALGSRQASVGMIFVLTICLGLAAMVLRHADTADAVMLLAQAVLILLMVTILERGRRSVQE